MKNNSKNVTCLICGGSFRRLGLHILKAHENMTHQEYYDRFLKKENEGLCPVCGKKTAFLGITKGYRMHCSVTCVRLNPDTSQEFTPDLSGKKFGKLTVLFRADDYIVPSTRKHKVMWHCLCDCGNECNVRASWLKMGTQSCGCIVKQRSVREIGDSLAYKYPGLLSEWDTEKNKPRTPKEIYAHSNKHVWWKCPKGHSYSMTVDARAKAMGCPYCSNHRVLAGFNDFATKNPYLIAEWDKEKNTVLPTEISPQSHRKIWWICPFGHSYQATPLSRAGVNHSGCPKCNKMTSFPEQALLYYIRKIFPDAENSNADMIGMELDIFIPSISVAIEYDGIAWHKNKKKREIEKNRLCMQKGIRLYRIREEGLPIYDDCYCIMRKNPRQDSSLSAAFMELLHCIAPDIEMSISIDEDMGAIYNEYIFNTKGNSLVALYPEVAEEWHPSKNGNLNASMVMGSTHKKVWWLGKCGHEWQATVASRTYSRAGCPICSGRKIVVGINDLFTIHPELRKEWDYELNDKLNVFPETLSVHSNIKVWWKCNKCGMVWGALVSNRTAGHGCPECAKRKRSVRCVENGVIYESIKEASKQTGILSQNIGMCCRRKSKTAGDYHWEYYKEKK